jgi:hypothetical protein
VSVWHARWQQGGSEALGSRGPSGPAPRLSDAQLATLEQALLCYGVRGGGAQLAFHITAGNYDTDTLIEVLGELRRFSAGRRQPCYGTDCHRIAAAPCGPGWRPSGPG